MSLSRQDRGLKLASGELVQAAGGIEASAAELGKGKSQVHRCTSVNDHANFLNLRDVALLEALTGAHPVTRLLCKRAGGVFLPLPEDFGDDHGLALQVMQVTHECGDVAQRVSEALADGHADAAELAAIEKEYDELVDKAVQGRAMVRAMLGKPAAPVRAVPRPDEAEAG